MPIVSTFRQPGGGSLLESNRRPEPSSRQPVQARQPAVRQPGPTVTAAPPAGPTLSLFDRIKARARGSSTAPTQSPRERAHLSLRSPHPPEQGLLPTLLHIRPIPGLEYLTRCDLLFLANNNHQIVARLFLLCHEAPHHQARPSPTVSRSHMESSRQSVCRDKLVFIKSVLNPIQNTII